MNAPLPRASLVRTLQSACFLSLLACAFALLFFPLRSRATGALANLTIAFRSEDFGPGLYPDRDFDFPTGSLYYDVPVWLIDLALSGLSAASLAGLFIVASGPRERGNPAS